MALQCTMVACTILELVVADVSDSILFFILFAFGCEMIRDGFSEMNKYCLMYGLLQALACTSYLLRFLTEIGGRTEYSFHKSNGHLTVNTSTSNFFDLSKGWKYNLESVAEGVTTLSTAYGAYLSLSAHKLLTEDEATQEAQLGIAREERRRDLGRLSQDMRRALENPDQASVGDTQTSLTVQRQDRFTGKAYKLSDDD